VQIGGDLKRLELNPYDKMALSNISQFFEKKNLNRVAAYFKGRLGSIKE
jgi:hypothetical protein